MFPTIHQNGTFVNPAGKKIEGGGGKNRSQMPMARRFSQQSPFVGSHGERAQVGLATYIEAVDELLAMED